MYKELIKKSIISGLFFSSTLFSVGFVFIKAASLTATSGTPLTAGNWNDMISNFFWGSGSGGIYYNGKVGIGTNAPNKDLHIYDTTNNAEIDLQSVAGTNKHWAIYQDKTNSNLYMWSNQNNVAITSGGNMDVLGKVNGIGGLCINGNCKTNWNQVGSTISNNYTGTCDSAHRGYSGIMSGYYKMCNGTTWVTIVVLDNYFAGAGSSGDPYRLNGELVGASTVSAKSCYYYNLNAGTLNTGVLRGTGTCGGGTSACLTDGIYMIDPDGAGGNNAFNVYCDMNTNGGGWTLVVGINGADSAHINAAAVTSTNLITSSGKGKYSDSIINSLVAAGNNGSGGLPSYRITCGSVTGFFKYSCTFNSTIDAAGDCVSESYAYSPPTYGAAKYSQSTIKGLADGSSGAANRLIYGLGGATYGCDTSAGWGQSGTVYVK